MKLLKIEEILILCLNECQQKEITRHLKWSEGATGATIKRLTERKLLDRTDRGKYKTTEKGRKILRTQIIEPPVREIIGMITQAAIFLEPQLKRRLTIGTLSPPKYENEDEYRRVQISVYNELRNIYFESVKNSHNDLEFTLAMWKTHEKPTCTDHGFDFTHAFEKNAHIIENLSQREIFEAIKLTPPADLLKKAKKEFFGDYPELEFTVLKGMTEKYLNE